MSGRIPERDHVGDVPDAASARPARRSAARTRTTRTGSWRGTGSPASAAQIEAAVTGVVVPFEVSSRAAEVVEGTPAEVAQADADSTVGPVDPEETPGGGELGRLWQEFKASGDQSMRERLILHYSPLVKYVAGRVGVGLPANVDHADLVSYGIFGLIDAIEKFDLARSIKFETYAISRIRGAIIDELRTIDWVPRSVRSKAREVERAYAQLETELHRTPTETEVAKRLDLSLTTCTRSSVRCRSSTLWPSTS